MYKQIFLLLGILNNVAVFSQSLIEIDIENGIENITTINCSEIINTIIYIPLSTEKESFFKKRPTVHTLDNNIILQTHVVCLIFNLETGKFKYRIGKKGQGPNEYRSTLRLLDYNNKSVYFKGWGNYILEYNLNNELIRSIDIPFINVESENPSLPTQYGVLNNSIICYFSNIGGKEDKLLTAIHKENSNLLFIIPNKNIFDTKRNRLYTSEALFYDFNENLYFKEFYNDTIFEIANENLIPHFIFKAGKYLFPYEKRWKFNPAFDEYIIDYRIFESLNAAFFHFLLGKKQLLGVYDKTKDRLKITDAEFGVINDIDGFVNFYPVNSTSNNELIGIIDAYKIVQWFKENPEKITKLPPQLQKLKDIKETDNPVVMIAKLKK